MLGVPRCTDGCFKQNLDWDKSLWYLCCIKEAESWLSAPPTFQQMLLLSHAHIMTPHWVGLLSTKDKTKEHHWSCSHASLCLRLLQISGAENCVITFHKSSQKNREPPSIAGSFSSFHMAKLISSSGDTDEFLQLHNTAETPLLLSNTKWECQHVNAKLSACRYFKLKSYLKGLKESKA